MSGQNTYRAELEVARRAGEEAAELIRSYRDEGGFAVDFKGRNDLVTDADLAAERKILEIISAAYPEDQIMAEETSGSPVLPDSRTWLVDPIDGTTNFAHGFPVSCVSIALWEGEQARMGVVLEVNSGECFYALRGEGAWLGERRLRVSGVEEAGNALIGTGFPYNDMSLIGNYLRFFEWLVHRTQGIRRPGAASYDLCCVAAGRYDGFYEYALNPWDVGAAGLVVEEAGGLVTDWEGTASWLFGKRIVAGNPSIHAYLLKGIGEHFTEAERRG